MLGFQGPPLTSAFCPQKAMLAGIAHIVLLSVERLIPPEIKSCSGQQKSSLYFYKLLFIKIFTSETVLRMLRLRPASPLADDPSSGFSAMPYLPYSERTTEC